MSNTFQNDARLPISRPVFGQREKELIGEVLDSGWVVQGPMVKRFEGMVAQYTGAEHAVAVSSCTTGLHLVLQALGIGPGDEVVLPSFTYIASANAVEYTGARPVFCDIDLDRFTLDLHGLQKALTPKTRVIMPVSLFGLGVDHWKLNALARENGLLVVEDAACSIGAWVSGRHSGASFTAAVFSLHPRKTITTGEGGVAN